MGPGLLGTVEVEFGPVGGKVEPCPVRIAFDGAGRGLKAEMIIPRALWNRLTEHGQRNFASTEKKLPGTAGDGTALSVHVGAATDLGFTPDGRLVFGVIPQSVTFAGGAGGAKATGL